MRTLIRSRWLATMLGGIIENGAVVVEDATIIAAGAHADVVRDQSVDDRYDLFDCVLLPGLINAHTHLELSDCTPGEKPSGGFETWLGRMVRRNRASADELDQQAAAAAISGTKQCLRFGVSSVADITRQCHATRPALRDSILKITSFGEVTAMAQRRDLLEPRIRLVTDAADATLRLRLGISPHAPYSVEPDGYRRCLAAAKAASLRLTTHLAESSAEASFLADHTGPLRALWDAGLGWDNDVPTFDGGPIRLAQEVGLLAYPSLLAHVNYCDDDELAILARGRASVIYCPRTHDFFSHPPHRFRDMLAAGINVAVGTDSCASSPDLNIVEDLRLIHRQHPDMKAIDIWQMATVNSARAMARDDVSGALLPGAPADLVAFPASGPDPLLSVLESDALPSRFWISGTSVL